jgi:hypothetical protein
MSGSRGEQGGNGVNWINNRWHDVTALGSGAWLAIAAWVAVGVAVLALMYVARQIRENRRLTADQIRPQVVMFMEPHPSDWHLIELVVKNYGKTAAYDIKFAFFNPPTVPAYERSDEDGRVEVVPLELPEELPVLAPGQEWRTVWDSARDRAQLGDAIDSRFVGAVTYYRSPAVEGSRKTRQRMQANVILDWNALQPVPRLELLTTHELAKREKQKLELLRSVLNYFSYASKETRPEVLRGEIERMNRAAEETHDRWRTRQMEEAPDLEEAPHLESTTELDLPWVEAEAGRHHR